MLKSTAPEKLGNKKGSREPGEQRKERVHGSPWEGEIEEIFVGGLSAGGDGNMRDQVGGTWRERVLKKTTGKERYF